jgi:hypothetical protein
MDERSMVRAPRWITIAIEQFRLVGLRFRVAGASLLTLGVLVSSAFVWFLARIGAGFITSRNIALANHALSAHVRAKLTVPLGPIPIIYAPEISTVIVAIALLLPLALWQDEPPARRDYHLVMPMRASTHTLIRVLAGWLWMMVITALYLTAVVAVPAVVGWVPGALPTHVIYFTWWEWLVPFTAATVAYVFASAAAVGARRPLVWLGGAVILYAGGVTLLVMLQMPDAAATLLKGFAGFYGAAAAMAGQVEGTAGVPSLSRWLGATTIWGLAGAALLVGVAHRRTEAAS